MVLNSYHLMFMDKKVAVEAFHLGGDILCMKVYMVLKRFD